MSQTCCTIIVPGPKGDAGLNGGAGSNGRDAFSHTTGLFTMPAVGATANQGVVDSSWACVGLFVVTQNLGYFLVTAVPDAFTLTLQNLGYSVNVAPGTIQGAGWLILPTGPIGLTGPAGPNIFKVYDNIAALRATTSHGAGYGSMVNGLLVAYDGQGGLYSYDPTSGLADDGINIIQPTDVPVGQLGRWRKLV